MQDLIAELVQQRLEAYEKCPRDVREHASIEENVLAGRYGYRQIHELVQNGADAISEFLESKSGKAEPRRIEVFLSERFLYVANTGAPISCVGVEALLSSHSSPKRGNQIGRFGLGFKSLLRLGGKIDLFGKALAFRFDPQRCVNELRSRFSATSAPGLRLAWMLNRLDERDNDRYLENFDWATTIVRAEIGDANAHEVRQSLLKEMQEFPAEFLLFLPASVNLVLKDANDFLRELRRDGDCDCQLWEGEKCAKWRVFIREVRIDDPAARNDASHIHQRESVPISWAVPLSSRREESGVFWAFFPTQTSSSVAGILNAPWKLDSDRNGLIEGKWNSALMKAAGQMVSESISVLGVPDDPGTVLDYFPRQPEAKELSTELVATIWDHLRDKACVPDANGVMRIASELKIHPIAKEDIASLWTAIADETGRSQMVHPSALRGNRFSRLAALAKQICSSENRRGNLTKSTAAEWFGEIASVDLERSRSVLSLTRAYQQATTGIDWNQIYSTIRIIAGIDGKCHTSGEVVIAPAGTEIPGRTIVEPRLSSDSECRSVLIEILRVKELDDIQWSHLLKDSLLKATQTHWASNEWRSLWACLRRAPFTTAKKFMTENSERIRVQRRDKQWVQWDELLLRGAIIPPEENSPNDRFLVFSEQHSEDTHLLSLLGVSDLPPVDRLTATSLSARGSLIGNGLDEWRSQCVSTFRNSLSGHHRNPQENMLKTTNVPMPGGWKLLSRLTGKPKARLTRYVLEAFPLLALPKAVLFKHTTQRTYPEINVPHPLPWLLLRFGGIEVSGEVFPLKMFIANCGDILTCFPNYLAFGKVFDVLKEYPWQPEIEEYDKQIFWGAIFDSCFRVENAGDASTTKLVVASASDGFVPEHLIHHGFRISIEDVYVTSSSQLAQLGLDSELPVVLIPEPGADIWRNAGAQSLDKCMRVRSDVALGPTSTIADTFPDLGTVLSDGSNKYAKCQLVEGLRIEIVEQSKPIPCCLEGDTLLVDPVQLSNLPRLSWLKLLLEQVAQAGWLNGSLDSALQLICDRTLHERKSMIASRSTLRERLWYAVGCRREPLLECLEELARKSFVRSCTDEELTSLVLTQLGPTTLSRLHSTLDREGLHPPQRWSSDEARQFVQSIGFPLNFAVAETVRRPYQESISGPIPLPPLHDYQVEVIDGLTKILSSKKGRRRTVISLPTGGGKTRVSVQAAVDLFLIKPEPRGVLWIAQTDELCEQAVQAFLQVWMNRGVERTLLRVARMWGGNPFPEKPSLNEPIVVVSSIQTMNSRLTRPELNWLKSVDLVVIDECHHAITKSYSNLLRWLDIQLGQQSAKVEFNSKVEPVIVGLSATPFRTDEEESLRLAKRFDSTWLPSDQSQLHQRLLDRGILAKAKYLPLNYQSKLSDSLLMQLEDLIQRGDGIELENLLEEINIALSEDGDRSEFIVNTIEKAYEQSIMLFANSVSHSKELAARLQLKGINAAEISGNTSSTARRFFLKQFQEGELRVLCNHSVLATGFDAPRVDMVLIARQVFSPVRYMQMVGRGLRGVANGGTSECNIITILDNLGRFTVRRQLDIRISDN